MRYPKGSTPTLTSELIDRLADAVRGGLYVETAAALCGISKDTFYRWLREGGRDDASDPLKALSDAVTRALAEAEFRDLQVIGSAAQAGDWKAAAWRLERKHAERWGRQERVQVEHSGVPGKPVEISDRSETLKKLLADPAAMLALETLERAITDEPETNP
jgi:transposase